MTLSASTASPPASTANDLLDLEQYAALTRRTPNAIYQERYRGNGPRAVKVGRRLLYRRADIEAWLEKHADPAAS